MKCTNIFTLLLMAFSLSVQADAYKCKQKSGKIIYQSSPCDKSTVQEEKVKVKKLSPEEAAAAKAKLEAWQQQQATEDALKQNAEKARQAELQQQESLELQRRSVVAQEQQAAKPQQNPGYGVGLSGRRYGDYPYNNGYNPGIYHPGYPQPPYPPGHGGQYYQYPDQPKRRPGEYPYPTTPPKTSPIIIPHDER